MSPELAGLVGVLVALLLMFTGANVAIAMAAVGMVGVSLFVGVNVGFESLAPTIFSRIANYDLAVLPLFILMGQLMFASGGGERLYAAARAWMGHWPGGLAIATVAACAGFAAISGSAIATAATIGAFALPEMRRAGYPMGFAGATVAASGTLGILIPPSVTFIIYGILVNESIGRLFIAGIAPGLIMALGFMAVVAMQERRRFADTQRAPAASREERLRSLGGLIEPALLIGIVIGGMFGGIFTPNEAGAIGAMGALLFGLARRALGWEAISKVLTETAATSAVVIFIIAGSAVLSTFLTVTRIPFTLADTINASELPQFVVLALIVIGYLIAGMVMEILPVIIITVPIFAPIIVNMGYDLIWFGVLIVILGQAGMITPPVGVNIFVVKRMLPQVGLGELFRSVWTFVGVMLVIVAVMIGWKGSVAFFLRLFE
ncbi:TRAP transporter large permease [Ramlibacter henchirensis]|uniref:TRAP transporter large permease protein n=1 Tax=Ramlibacter henchirensis TaxID=204072 RepID=A0A4Z0BPA5_9BURK|nr:TRAP transporter large permease [Ramlibacter henchirensis]TFZ00592.1 TRAP transporter large permease [Ramlibacter henchirensis]